MASTQADGPSDEHIYIKGFGLANYRSFGPERQMLCPFGRINIFSGANNCGKSNILRAIQAVYHPAAHNTEVRLVPFQDYHKNSPTELTIAIGPPEQAWSSTRQIPKRILDFFDAHWPKYSGQVLLSYKPGARLLQVYEEQFSNLKELVDSELGSQFFRECMLEYSYQTSGSRGDLDNLLFFADVLERKLRTCPEVRMISAMRKLDIGKGGGGQKLPNMKCFTGESVITYLAELYAPLAEVREQSRAVFNKIQQFVRDVLNDPSCEIHLSHDKQQLSVDLNSRIFDLKELGTGVHQLILLAAAATIYEGEILLLEEPETNLHPGLQRKLMHYLLSSTTNQYFITTHSPTIIDYPGSSVFHCYLAEDQTTRVELVECNKVRGRILDSLDVRASDLLQSNCVIWVEGPSDRTYVKHFIKLVDPELEEGLHFSILFYGGSNLAHLSALDYNDERLEQFISVVRINRHSFFLADSDRRQADKSLKPALQRIQQELFPHDDTIWITEGREIENYIPIEILRKAFSKVHPRSEYKWAGAEPGSMFEDVTLDASGANFGKVEMAAEVTQLLVSETDLPENLRAQIDKLVKFIRQANGHQQPINESPKTRC